MGKLINSGLICFWDFGKPEPLTSKSNFQYTLKPHGDIGFNEGRSICIEEGQYLSINRKDCPALNIYGKNAQVTVFAWIKRKPKSFVQCEAIAGMWDETRRKRQYCLFLNLRLFDSADQVCGHISSVGGATPGEKWCIDASIGNTPVALEEWTFVAFTYDAEYVKSYYNGKLDSRVLHNPYRYEGGIFDGEVGGSDFTVGAVHRLGEIGNDFVGEIAKLAVYDRALSDEEILEIFNLIE